jgi:hypothetical protein
MGIEAVNKLISEGYTQLNSTIVGGNYRENFVRGNETVTYRSETGLFYYNSGRANHEVWEFSNDVFYEIVEA